MSLATTDLRAVQLACRTGMQVMLQRAACNAYEVEQFKDDSLRECACGTITGGPASRQVSAGEVNPASGQICAVDEKKQPAIGTHPVTKLAKCLPEVPPR